MILNPRITVEPSGNFKKPWRCIKTEAAFWPHVGDLLTEYDIVMLFKTEIVA